MAASSGPPSDSKPEHLRPASQRVRELRCEPRGAFRAALARYKGSRLAAIRLAQGAEAGASHIRSAANAEEITEFLDRPAAVKGLLERLSTPARIALSVFALSEATSLPLGGLVHGLRILGAGPSDLASVVRLLELGLLAVEAEVTRGPISDFATAFELAGVDRFLLRVHPAVRHAARTTQPDHKLAASGRSIAQVREVDGMQPILALAALWQRVASEPLRRTQQNTLYKRDLERLASDSVLAAPIYDALAPLPDASTFWLALAQRVGLVLTDPAADRLIAAPADFWDENALHLPQMIATAWLGLETWLESGLTPPGDAIPALPYLRVAALLALSTLGESEWIAVEDLADHFSALSPAWDQSWLTSQPPRPVHFSRRDGRAAVGSAAPECPRGSGLLTTLLCGAAHTLGLVKAAEERGSGRRVVQLAPLGRYVLALGPTPPPRPLFEQFLFVQPNFQVIAYRQGLTPQSAGALARFAWFSQIGAALELALTRESIVQGLSGGLTSESILQTLARHSQRPVPPNVIDAVTRWASRRERVVYYDSASLVEFASGADRDTALAFWPHAGGAEPVIVGERFLLVEDEGTVPFDRLRLTSTRDYRRPPQICVTVEQDGVTLALDPTTADLLVDAELARFAELLHSPQSARVQVRSQANSHAPSSPTRRYVVTAESLARGLKSGVNPLQLAAWFTERTGGGIPPAVGLLLAAAGPRRVRLSARRTFVLNLGSAELLDGLMQHPATRRFVGERLGPVTAVVPDDHLPALKKALHELGFSFEVD
jgi:Helicase conserved C-terminal domain